jgi:hypothetical protein
MFGFQVSSPLREEFLSDMFMARKIFSVICHESGRDREDRILSGQKVSQWRKEAAH